MVKNPTAKQETWVQSLGREDPLEKEMATHSSILAWRIPWTEEPGKGNGKPLQYSCLENPMDRGAWQGYSSWGLKESDMTEHTHII